MQYDPTARVHSVLGYAQAEGDIVCIHGRSGAGKTTALQHYTETHTGTFS